MGCIGACIYLFVLCVASEATGCWYILGIGILIPIIFFIVTGRNYAKFDKQRRDQEMQRKMHSKEIITIIINYIDSIGGFKSISSHEIGNNRFDLTILNKSGESIAFSFESYGYNNPSRETISEIYKDLIKHYDAVSCHTIREFGGISTGYSVTSSGNVYSNTTSGQRIEVYCIRSREYAAYMSQKNSNNKKVL